MILSRVFELINYTLGVPSDTTLHRSTTLTGVYEGGGYKSRGIYRPAPDCRMKTNRAPGFCAVCAQAVEERIRFLTAE
jgi:hypothetical protein